MHLKEGSHIHLMGICGTAMASLAGLLQLQGYKITGSDQNVYPPMSTQLAELGIAIMDGYRKENLQPQPDFVIVGNVISGLNEEAQALLASDIPYTSLPKALAEFAIQHRHSIVAAGTHGKTTVTSMMIRVAEDCGVNPGYMVGGIPIDYGRSFKASSGDYFIIEGDEYDTAFFDKVPKFIHYKPKYVILTSVEFDHADIYNNLEDVKKAFRMLIDRIPKDGILVAYAEDHNVMELVQQAKCKVVTYGFAKSKGEHQEISPDYKIVDRAMIENRNHFSIHKNDVSVADIAIKLPGEHNALNAAAVFALSQELGWNKSCALQGLASFQGVKRRQEVLGTLSGVTLIEDFAHHPTAVRLTTAAIREKYLGGGASRLISLFEPRSATSRRKIFQKDYVKAFETSDFVLIARAFDQSKIAEGDRFSSAELVADLNTVGVNAVEGTDVDSMVMQVKSFARRGDVIIIMSNGGFGGIYKKLQTALG